MLNTEVNYAALVVPSEQCPATREDDQELIRTIYFGEALRAIQTYVSETLLSGPSEPMLDLLGEAFERLRNARSEFTPEEFTTYYMSMLLDLCQDADETRRLKSGAMHYMLASAAALPPDFSSLVEEARRLLVADGGTLVETDDMRSASSHRLASLLAQARVRPADEKALKIPIAGGVSSPPQASDEASGLEGQRTRSQPSLRRRRALSQASGATSGSGILPAALWVVVLLFYFYFVVTGVIEPVM
jgi:hypothetical protein